MYNNVSSIQIHTTCTMIVIVINTIFLYASVYISRPLCYICRWHNIWRETKNRIIDPCSSEHDVKKKQNLYVSIRGNFVNSLGFSGTIRCQGTWSTLHYNDVIMRVMASRITSLTIVYSSIYSGSDQRKHQSSASLAFVRGIHRWPVNSPHKWLVTRKMFPFDNGSSEHDIKNKYVSIRGNFVNSLRPGGAIWCQGTCSTLVQSTSYNLLYTKPIDTH